MSIVLLGASACIHEIGWLPGAVPKLIPVCHVGEGGEHQVYVGSHRLDNLLKEHILDYVGLCHGD